MNKTTRLASTLCATCVLGANVANAANAFFRPAGGAAVGYWDVLGNWWTTESYDTQSSRLPNGVDWALVYAPGVTAIVTNNLPLAGSYTRNAALAIGTETAGSQAALIVKDGGVVSTLFTDIGGSKNGSGRTGLLVVEKGGIFTNLNDKSGFTLGNVNGLGIVTNSGTISSDYNITIGLGAGGHGIWVHDGGTERPTVKMQHNIYVGDKGLGELIVKSGVFSGGAYFSAYPDYGMIAVGGTNTVTSRIEILDGASLKNGFWYVGGYPGHPKGRGEIALRGGSILCITNAQAKNSMMIGAWNDGSGSIDPDCYGAIRGWGSVTNAAGVKHDNGMRILLGNGEIVADGEGTAKTLDLMYVCQATNALTGTTGNTNGWRAIRKGLLKLPPTLMFKTGSYMSATKCVGCATDLAQPDLVNSIKVSATRKGYTSLYSFYIHTALYASDRDDIHLNALPEDASIVGVWQVGAFTEEESVAAEHKVGHDISAQITFRYDQTKLQSAQSKLELRRYDATSGRWSLLTTLAPSERTAANVITSPEGLSKVNDDYNLGLFAVIERSDAATVIYMR